MVHLEATRIVPIVYHPLELALNRIPNRLGLGGRVALGTRGCCVVLPISAIDISRDDGAAVDIGLAFDVDGEVVGDGNNGESGGCSVADEAGLDVDGAAGF
jgi:hypothetical protein